MLKKLLSLALASLLLSIAVSLPAVCQDKGQQGQQGRKEQQKPVVEPKKTKAVNESCDGALNIVPTKSMTFMRKRRPAQSEAKQEPEPGKNKESKPAERRPGEGQ